MSNYTQEQINQRRKELGIDGSMDNYVPVGDRGKIIKFRVTVEADETDNRCVITTENETQIGDGRNPFSIRGKCSGAFFVKTVNAFYARHPEIEFANDNARKFSDGEWCTFFRTKAWTESDVPDWPVKIPAAERVETNELREVPLQLPKNAEIWIK